MHNQSLFQARVIGLWMHSPQSPLILICKQIPTCEYCEVESDATDMLGRTCSQLQAQFIFIKDSLNRP